MREYDGVLRRLAGHAAPSATPMTSVADLGTRDARVTPLGADDADHVAGLVELLAEHDEALLAAYVDDEASIPYARLREALAAQTAASRVQPGVLRLGDHRARGSRSCPRASPSCCRQSHGDADGPVSGTVFKIERGPAGDKVAYVRLFSGTVRTRDLVTPRTRA